MRPIDVFSIRKINKEEVTEFIEQANSHHPTIKFKYPTQKQYSLTQMFSKARDLQNSLYWTKLLKHFSARISQVATHQGSKRASLLKAKNLDFSETAFKTAIHKSHRKRVPGPKTLVSIILSEITFKERKHPLQQKRKQSTQILPFVTQYRPSVPNLKQILIQN